MGQGSLQRRLHEVIGGTVVEDQRSCIPPQARNGRQQLLAKGGRGDHDMCTWAHGAYSPGGGRVVALNYVMGWPRCRSRHHRLHPGQCGNVAPDPRASAEFFRAAIPCGPRHVRHGRDHRDGARGERGAHRPDCQFIQFGVARPAARAVEPVARGRLDAAFLTRARTTPSTFSPPTSATWPSASRARTDRFAGVAFREGAGGAPISKERPRCSSASTAAATPRATT
jgi:hypothetical protein